MKKKERIAGNSGKKFKEVIVEMYPELFTGLEQKEPEHHIKLNDNAPPILNPIGLHEKLKK